MTFAVREQRNIVAASGGTTVQTISAPSSGAIVIPSGFTNLKAEIGGSTGAGCPGSGSGDSAIGGGGGASGGYCASTINVSGQGGKTLLYVNGSAVIARTAAASFNNSSLSSGTLAITTMSVTAGGGGGQTRTQNKGIHGTATGGTDTNTSGNDGTMGGLGGPGTGGAGIAGVNMTSPSGGDGGYLSIPIQAGVDGLITLTYT